MDISVVIPVYNGQYTLHELHKRLMEELIKGCYNFEIIYVYDCGKDKSWGILQEIKHDYPDIVKAYHLDKNHGQHNAILFGLAKAIGDFIITLDEDLQHDPTYIIKLMEKQAEKNYDVVYAVFETAKHSGLRNFTSDLLRRILKAIIPDICPNYSPFRLIKRDIAQSLTKLHNSYTFIDGYLGWLKPRFGIISAIHRERKAGTSSYSFYKLLKHAVLVTIAYSPLKKWLLILALVVNVLSFFVNKITIGGSVHELYKAGYILGMILLVFALLTEIIHYSRIKLLGVPYAVKEI